MDFTIVTPNLNGARFLADCLRSARDQAGVSFEHLILDGGSTDGSAEISAAFPHVRWLSAPDRGMSDAINKGFALAQGEWIMWLNSDDRLKPGALAAVKAFAAAHPGPEILYGAFDFVAEDGSLLRRVKMPAWSRFIHIHHCCYIPSTAAFYRREAALAHPLRVDFRYVMDGELYARMDAAGLRFASIPLTLADFRLHAGNASMRHLARSRDMDAILAAERQHIESRAIRRAYGLTFFGDPYLNGLADGLLWLAAKTLKGFRKLWIPRPPRAMKIAAVFASYNRKELALECLTRLRNQTRPPELVVIGDNNSSDGSREAFAAIGWDAVQVINTGENLGNAGGVEAAMERAFELGVDAVWILDDDSWPQAGALEALVRDWDLETVRHSLQVDPRSGAYSWPLPLKAPDGSWKTAATPAEWPGGEIVQSRASWTGSLVPRQVREKTGPVLGALFIRGEDEEFPRRIAAAGFRFEAVHGSLLDHPSAAGLHRWRFFGKEFWFEPGLAPWKLYYEVRNNVWLQRHREHSQPRALLMAGLHAAALLIRGPRTSQHFTIWYEAVCDGFAGKLGRRDF